MYLKDSSHIQALLVIIITCNQITKHSRFGQSVCPTGCQLVHICHNVVNKCQWTFLQQLLILSATCIPMSPTPIPTPTPNVCVYVCVSHTEVTGFAPPARSTDTLSRLGVTLRAVVTVAVFQTVPPVHSWWTRCQGEKAREGE